MRFLVRKERPTSATQETPRIGQDEGLWDLNSGLLYKARLLVVISEVIWERVAARSHLSYVRYCGTRSCG